MFTLIRNANVFAPEPMGLCHVLVAGDRIMYVGSDIPDLDTRLNVDSVDAEGADLIPDLSIRMPMSQEAEERLASKRLSPLLSFPSLLVLV